MKLVKLAERFLDSARLHLNTVSAHGTKRKAVTTVGEQESFSIQLQEAEDRRRRALAIFNSAKLEVFSF